MASTARIDDIKKKFDENPRRYFAPLANEFRKMGDLEQAIMICEEFLPQQPGHMSGHIVYGQSLFEAGRFAEARTVFETALGLDPENLIALRHLGDIARNDGDLTGARSWYHRVLDADPRNEEIQGLLASLDESSVAPAHAAPEAPTPLPVSNAATTVVVPALPVAPREPAGTSRPIEPIDLAIDDEFVSAQEPVPAPPELSIDVTLPFGMPAIPAPGAAPAQAAEPASHAELPPDVPFEELTLEGLEPTHADHGSMQAPTTRAEGFEALEFEAPATPAARTEGLEAMEFEAPAPASTDESLLDLEESFAAAGAAPVVAPVNGLESDMSPPPSVGDLPMLDVDEGAAPPHGDVFALGAIAPDESLELPTEPAPDEPPRMGPPAAMEAMPALELDELPAPSVAPFEPEAAPMLELPPEVIAAESVLMDEMELAEPAAPPPPEEPASTPFVTETMAELYVKQGFRDQALAVYRQLSSAAPGDDRLRARVEELERADAAPAAPAGPTVREFFSRLAARRPGERNAASELPSDDDFAPAPVSVSPTPRPTPSASHSAISSAVERGAVGAGRATPAGSIDALFGNRAPATSEDSAASALAQAFGGSSQAELLAGRPARAASGELSLDSVFRDGTARPPRASQSFSFDQFFSESAAESAPSAPEPAAPKQPAERNADDIEQFNSWLQGLKHR